MSNPIDLSALSPARAQGRAAARTTAPVRSLLIGAGGMARHHLSAILQPKARSAALPSRFVAVVEPSDAAWEATHALFVLAGQPTPQRYTSLSDALAAHTGALDAAFIITPHVAHHDQALACLEAGLDVLLEKPMVMNRGEALSLREAEQRSGRRLVVAFNGSLSPRIRTAARWIQEGALGELVSISATCWQSWKRNSIGTWRQNRAQSGGGFLFDTGAHMLNTVCDLAGEPFVELSARLDPRGAPVDIVGVIWGMLRSGAWVTLHASGDTTPRAGAIGSDVLCFCTDGWLRTGIWGEQLLVQQPEAPAPVRVRTGAQPSAWETFLRIRAGAMANPAPAQLGVRMACLWDAIQASSAAGGAVAPVESEQ